MPVAPMPFPVPMSGNAVVSQALPHDERVSSGAPLCDMIGMVCRELGGGRYDALVVEGMHGAIEQKSVAIIEFEVNYRGFWLPKHCEGCARVEHGIVTNLSLVYPCLLLCKLHS